MRLKADSGFSLVEVLIGIAISSATALLIFKVMEESQTGLRQVENREAVNQLHREVMSRFSDRTICTQTFIASSPAKEAEFKIPKVVNESETLFTLPFTQGQATLESLTVKNLSPTTRRADVLATYTYRMKNQATTINRQFHAELSYRDGAFVGCISRGSAVMDPQEACDLVVGHDEEGKSYFYNGICHFGRAACEQSGRSWEEPNKKCAFSEDDIEALRQMICQTLGFNYNGSMCVLTQAHIDEVNRLKGSGKSQR